MKVSIKQAVRKYVAQVTEVLIIMSFAGLAVSPIIVLSTYGHTWAGVVATIAVFPIVLGIMDRAIPHIILLVEAIRGDAK